MEGVAGDVFEGGADEPVEAGGDVAGEGDGVALEVDAAVGCDEVPVGIEAPEKAVIVAGRVDLFGRCGGIFYFCDAAAAGLRGGMGSVEVRIKDVVFGVEDYGEYIFLFQS